MTQANLKQDQPITLTISISPSSASKIIDMLAGSTQVLAPIEPEISKNINYVYGYEGGMKLFNCSRPTFYRILKSQRIAPAIKQIGRKIVIDSTMALDLLSTKNGGRR